MAQEGEAQCLLLPYKVELRPSFSQQPTIPTAGETEARMQPVGGVLLSSLPLSLGLLLEQKDFQAVQAERIFLSRAQRK